VLSTTMAGDAGPLRPRKCFLFFVSTSKEWHVPSSFLPKPPGTGQLHPLLCGSGTRSVVSFCFSFPEQPVFFFSFFCGALGYFPPLPSGMPFYCKKALSFGRSLPLFFYRPTPSFELFHGSELSIDFSPLSCALPHPLHLFFLCFHFFSLFRRASRGGFSFPFLLFAARRRVFSFLALSLSGAFACPLFFFFSLPNGRTLRRLPPGVCHLFFSFPARHTSPEDFFPFCTRGSRVLTFFFFHRPVSPVCLKKISFLL